MIYSTTRKTFRTRTASDVAYSMYRHDLHGIFKQQDLDDQTSDDDGISDMGELRVGQQPGPVGLDVQGDEVTENEDPSGPAWGDEGKTAGLKIPDKARVDHVHRGGEEDGRQEQECGLHDE
ncbi:hypothetical protein B7463_g6042, partial [Scytalidium lignicola]